MSEDELRMIEASPYPPHRHKVQEIVDEVRRLLAVRAAVDADLAGVEARVRRGQGTWPGPDYVRGDDWASLLGRASALRRVLRQFADVAPQPAHNRGSHAE